MVKGCVSFIWLFTSAMAASALQGYALSKFTRKYHYRENPTLQKANVIHSKESRIHLPNNSIHMNLGNTVPTPIVCQVRRQNQNDRNRNITKLRI
jgi:hypothetical protein